MTKSFEIGELGDSTTIMRDPEGNGFCLQDPPQHRTHVHLATSRSPVPSLEELGRFWAIALGWPDEDIDEAIFPDSSETRAWVSLTSAASTW